MRLFDKTGKDFFKAGFAEELLFIRIKTGLGDCRNNGSVVCVLPIGAAFDQFPAESFLAADCLLECVFFNVGCPCHQIVDLGENIFHVFVGEQWRQLKFILRKLQIGCGTCAAGVLCLTETAPFTAEEVPVTSKGEVGSGLQDLIGQRSRSSLESS